MAASWNRAWTRYTFRLVENANTGNFELYDGGNLVFTQAINQTTDIDINADPGASSSLTIDYSGGVFSNAVHFDGWTGSGTHSLTIENGRFDNETATPTGAASGTITFDTKPMVQISSEGGTFAPVSFANKANVTVSGAGGDDTFRLDNPTPAAGLYTLQIDGGTGNNTLIGPNKTVTWYITGHNAGTVAVVETDTITFQNMENLTGGTSVDAFTFDGGSLDGTVDGGGGRNTLDYSLCGAANPITVNLQTGAATNTGGFLNIQALVGGAGSNTLIGANTPNTWDITRQNGGDINGTFSFYVIDNLIGGAGGDTFVFSPGAGVDGTVDGGGGYNNTLDYYLYGSNEPITVNLQTGAATGVGSFANIQNLIGCQATSNTLIGANTANTWKSSDRMPASSTTPSGSPPSRTSPAARAMTASPS